MPAHRMTMRKTREILRLRWGRKLSQREVGQSCNCAPSTVNDVEARARLAGLSWPLPDDLDDAGLEVKLYPVRAGSGKRPQPNFKHIHLELGRPGVTLALLWEEYRSAHPNGYGYTRFCDLYREWRGQLDVSMRQAHTPGEKLYVDFAGTRAVVHDAVSGEAQEVSVFVAALGASQLIYAEAVPGEDLHSWLGLHQRTFEFLGGVPAVVVPDNLKSAVTKACFYDPELNRSYKDLADHYETVILPARVRRPKDKAKVENAVQQVERWVLAPLRNQRFFSLVELNQAIRQRLEWLNQRPLSKLEQSRQQLFDEVDKPALKPLPKKRFEIPEWKRNVGVNIDYHIEFDNHYYSVPCQLMRKRVDVRATSTTVECLHEGVRVALHPRSYVRGKSTTTTEHRPKSHRDYADWTPSRMLRWAGSIGPQTEAAVQAVMNSKRHPEEGYRASLGVIRLATRYGKERLERACERALGIRSPSYKTIHSILKTGMDQQPLNLQPLPLTEPVDHENVRGANYYN